MDMCVLQPPNSQQFSDDVITGVVQRSRSARDSFIQVDRNISTQDANGNRPYPSMNTSPGPWVATQDNAPPMPLADRKRGREHLSSMSVSATGGEVVKKAAPDNQVAAFARLVIIEKERLRELRRMRQIRYRKKKENYALSLEEETRRLRGEIESLSHQRRAASVAASMNDSVWSVAAEYFRLFQFGIRESTSEGAADSSLYDRFLRTRMASDVVFNAEHGSEALLKSWRSLSLWFTDIEVELEGLTKAGADLVIATTVTSVTITHKTLQGVLPHLRGDSSEASAGSQLVDKLLGRRIAMRGVTHFYWDSESGRVVRIKSQSDMLTPVLHLVGGLENASDVFQGSLVSLDFQWKPGSASLG